MGEERFKKGHCNVCDTSADDAVPRRSLYKSNVRPCKNRKAVVGGLDYYYTSAARVRQPFYNLPLPHRLP